MALKEMLPYFPKAVSYNRFVELIPRVAVNWSKHQHYFVDQYHRSYHTLPYRCSAVLLKLDHWSSHLRGCFFESLTQKISRSTTRSATDKP